jgi:hypothetical protein
MSWKLAQVIFDGEVCCLLVEPQCLFNDVSLTTWIFIFLCRFDPIPGHGLHLRGFTITLRYTTVGGTPLDE